MSDPRNLGPEARENKGTTGMNSKNMEKTMGMETAKRSEADDDSLQQSKELPQSLDVWNFQPLSSSLELEEGEGHQ